MNSIFMQRDVRLVSPPVAHSSIQFSHITCKGHPRSATHNCIRPKSKKLLYLSLASWSGACEMRLYALNEQHVVCIHLHCTSFDIIIVVWTPSRNSRFRTSLNRGISLTHSCLYGHIYIYICMNREREALTGGDEEIGWVCSHPYYESKWIT